MLAWRRFEFPSDWFLNVFIYNQEKKNDDVSFMWAGGAVWAEMALNPAPGFLVSPEESSCHVRLEALTSQKNSNPANTGHFLFPCIFQHPVGGTAWVRLI